MFKGLNTTRKLLNEAKLRQPGLADHNGPGDFKARKPLTGGDWVGFAVLGAVLLGMPATSVFVGTQQIKNASKVAEAKAKGATIEPLTEKEKDLLKKTGEGLDSSALTMVTWPNGSKELTPCTNKDQLKTWVKNGEISWGNLNFTLAAAVGVVDLLFGGLFALGRMKGRDKSQESEAK